MIDRDEYAVRLLDMPASVGGFIKESPDGFVNIYINARHSWHGQRRSFRHELRHAEHDDLHSTEPLAIIEARADQKPSPDGEGGGSSGQTDEVPFTLRAIPHLMCARDLLPPPQLRAMTDGVVPRSPSRSPSITPHQARVLANCITVLDRALISNTFFDY